MLFASATTLYLLHAKSKTNTMEGWNTMKSIYQTRSKMHKVDLGKKLQNAKLGDEDDAHAHFTWLVNMREQLTAMGKNLDDNEFTSIVLGSLPPSYVATVGGINAAADTTGNAITSNQVICLISDEYDSCMMKKGKNGPDEAFAANSQKQCDKRNVECYNCHNFSHYKSDCWAKGGGKEGQRPPKCNDSNSSSDNHGNHNRNDQSNSGSNQNNHG